MDDDESNGSRERDLKRAACSPIHPTPPSKRLDSSSPSLPVEVGASKMAKDVPSHHTLIDFDENSFPQSTRPKSSDESPRKSYTLSEDEAMRSFSTMDRDASLVLSQLNSEEIKNSNPDSIINLLTEDEEEINDFELGIESNILKDELDNRTSESDVVISTSLPPVADFCSMSDSMSVDSMPPPANISIESWAQIQLPTRKNQLSIQDSLEAHDGDMSESVDWSMSESDLPSEVYDAASLACTRPDQTVESDDDDEEKSIIDTTYQDIEYKYGLSQGGSSFSSISSFKEDSLPEKRKKKKKKSKTKGGLCDSEVRPATPITLRPNYFVGIQVSNPMIHKSVVNVQQGIYDNCPELSRALIDVGTLHLTLLVAHIADDEASQIACSALDKCCIQLEDTLLKDPVNLTFSGLSHFSNQTLYIKLVEDEHYQRLMEISRRIRKVFVDFDVCLPDEKEFHPHLTILKLSKSPRSKKRPHKIDPRVYEEYKDMDFGCQTVSSLQLLCMHKPKDENRYYNSAREVVLDVPLLESGDHSGCCFPRRFDSSSLKQLARSYSTDAAESIKESTLSLSDVLSDKNRDDDQPSTDAAVKSNFGKIPSIQTENTDVLLIDISHDDDLLEIKNENQITEPNETPKLNCSLLDDHDTSRKENNSSDGKDSYTTFEDHKKLNINQPKFIKSLSPSLTEEVPNSWKEMYVEAKESEDIVSKFDPEEKLPETDSEKPPCSDKGINSWFKPVMFISVMMMSIIIGLKLLHK